MLINQKCVPTQNLPNDDFEVHQTSSGSESAASSTFSSKINDILISTFVGRLSDEEHSTLDRIFARFVFSTNLAHSVVENEHVRWMEQLKKREYY